MKKIILFIILTTLSVQSIDVFFSSYCLHFDGVNDYVAVSHDNDLNVTAITIELWMYWTGSGVQFLTAKDYEGYEIHTTSDNRLRFIPAPGVFLDTPINSISANEWTHVALSYDPSGAGFASCYINGKEKTLTNNEQIH
jgi:hypothetical protein